MPLPTLAKNKTSFQFKGNKVKGRSMKGLNLNSYQEGRDKFRKWWILDWATVPDYLKVNVIKETKGENCSTLKETAEGHLSVSVS